MEEKAVETLRIMLGRRGLDTKADRIVMEGVERANFYSIGNILVVFSQKENGISFRDVGAYSQFAFAGEQYSGLIIVALAPPSDTVLKMVRDSAKRNIQFFHIRQLLFDITTHRMAMPHRILKEEERTAVFKRYNVTKPEEQLPWIDSQDAMIKWIGAVPGDVIEVTRHSDVAGPQLYYRYCVADVNLA